MGNSLFKTRGSSNKHHNKLGNQSGMTGKALQKLLQKTQYILLQSRNCINLFSRVHVTSKTSGQIHLPTFHAHRRAFLLPQLDNLLTYAFEHTHNLGILEVPPILTRIWNKNRAHQDWQQINDSKLCNKNKNYQLNHTGIQHKTQYRGVDNGAAGAAAAAPIIWLVVVIQKGRTFRRPKHIFLCLYECNLS